MSKFGWSYPPGCSGPPEDNYPCEVCWQWHCICPECPECSDIGNPRCYAEHGLVLNPEQLKSRADKVAQWEIGNKEDASDDKDFPPRCDVCGLKEADCICPACPVCGAYGDPKCYEEHGMERTNEQRWTYDQEEEMAFLDGEPKATERTYKRQEEKRRNEQET